MPPLHSHCHTPRDTGHEAQPYPICVCPRNLYGVFSDDEPTGRSQPPSLHSGSFPSLVGCFKSTRGPLAWWGHSSLSPCPPCLTLRPVLVFLGMIFLAENLSMTLQGQSRFLGELIVRAKRAAKGPASTALPTKQLTQPISMIAGPHPPSQDCSLCFCPVTWGCALCPRLRIYQLCLP